MDFTFHYGPQWQLQNVQFGVVSILYGSKLIQFHSSHLHGRQTV